MRGNGRHIRTTAISKTFNSDVGRRACRRRRTGVRSDRTPVIDINGHATRDRDDLAKDRGGLKRLVLRVVDGALPVEELVEALR